MSMQDLERAFELFEKYKKDDDFVGSRDEILIQKAEKVLNLTFPPTYRRFLKQYGCGGIRGLDVYGIGYGGFEAESCSNIVWLVLKYRKNYNLHLELVIISDDGMGNYYCLDCVNVNEFGEGPIVMQYVGHQQPLKEMEKIANDFGEFLLNEVKHYFKE